MRAFSVPDPCVAWLEIDPPDGVPGPGSALQIFERLPPYWLGIWGKGGGLGFEGGGPLSPWHRRSRAPLIASSKLWASAGTWRRTTMAVASISAQPARNTANRFAIIRSLRLRRGRGAT